MLVLLFDVPAVCACAADGAGNLAPAETRKALLGATLTVPLVLAVLAAAAAAAADANNRVPVAAKAPR